MKHVELDSKNNSDSNRWLAGSAGIYIILVLNLFEPFGITIHPENLIYHTILSSYGLISLLTVFIWQRWAQPRLKLSVIKSDQLKIVTGLAILVIIVSLSNWLYSQMLHYTISGWRNMYIPIRSFTELMPQFVAIYSVWAIIGWSHLYYMQKMAKQPALESNNLEQSVTLYSDNQSDSFKVKRHQVVCLKTCDNYLEVYYLNEASELQKRLIRSSMKKMAKNLNEDSFYRPHQSYMVNLAYVKGLKKLQNNYFIEMSYLEFDVAIARKYVSKIKAYLVS